MKRVALSVIIILLAYSVAFGEQVNITIESYANPSLGIKSTVIELTDPYDPNDTDDQLEMAYQAILFAISPAGWDLANHNFTTPSPPAPKPGWTNPYSATGVDGTYFIPDSEFYEDLLGYQVNDEAWWAINNTPTNSAMWLVFHTDLWCERGPHDIGESPDNYGVISGVTAGVFAQCPVPNWGSFTVEVVPEPPPPPALVGYWKFDEANGSIALDSSVFGNHGIIRGATRTTGQCQNALSFDGGTNGLDYVVVPNSDSINTNTFTISFWASLSDLDRHHVFLHKRNGQWHSNYQVSYYAESSAPGVPLDDYLYVGIGDKSPAPTSYSYAAYAAVNLVEGQLYHVAATYDLSVLRLYLNGEEIATKDLSMTNTTGDGDLYIGAHPYHGALYATDGVIDEVRIYNYALTQEQIQADMQCPPVPAISGCINYEGSPLTGVEVNFKEKGEKWQTTQTDENGCYLIESVVSGEKMELRIGGFSSE
jgi:hypothetical protein